MHLVSLFEPQYDLIYTNASYIYIYILICIIIIIYDIMCIYTYICIYTYDGWMKANVASGLQTASAPSFASRDLRPNGPDPWKVLQRCLVTTTFGDWNDTPGRPSATGTTLH